MCFVMLQNSNVYYICMVKISFNYFPFYHWNYDTMNHYGVSYTMEYNFA